VLRQGNRRNDGSAWSKEKHLKWTETRGGTIVFCHIINRIIEMRAFFSALKSTLGVL